MRIWDVLGIEPTKDMSVIKKAYAAKLKIHHPESDPSGYQQLREAYDTALRQSRQQAAQAAFSELDELDDSYNESAELTELTELTEQVEQIEQTKHSMETVQVEFRQETWMETYIAESDEDDTEEDGNSPFYRQLEKLYEDISLRVNLHQWQALFNEDFTWDIGEHEARLDELMEFLGRNSHLPHEVWKLLDDTFDLRENREEMLECYEEGLVTYVLQQVEGVMALGYICFAIKEPDAAHVEEYLNLRQSAQFMLMKDDPDMRGFLESTLAEANDLYQDDPDLQLIRAKNFIQLEKVDEALVCLNHAIALQPVQMEAYLLRAQLLYDERRYEEAWVECESLLEGYPEQQDVICLSLQCHVAVGNVEAAWQQTEQKMVALNRFYHFRHGVQMLRLRNKNLHSQKYNNFSPEIRRKTAWYDLLNHFVVFLNLSWMTLLVYGVCELFVDLSYVWTIVVLFIVLKNLWKTCKTAYLFST
ncbi:J domain-containing protein [Paenibacillus sp. 481]|uniref:J domain-containing protein n=1 Tax=Paenibacillus sp. 481 TaxID=2835869 RepID=UPI001E546378|nr:J domain-containing protein [Paenibacillus sp. 481]UHA75067.1 hypothetical protein KIK04_08615 [Paenibacillus sp. 481]